ncbi:hypothetical protein SteCoe_169 [Stentor coeruleus]|uniref:Uncharacterized protein n=1 Tax=Stentor coeruleus TaxID=5963 RepID=A0A1R2D4Q9_9CILI|nr:hypothetical protein SteCoe_169 [Stentor coeruleus]
MLSPDLYDQNFEDFLKSLNHPRNKKVKPNRISQRIGTLSSPKKQQLVDTEDNIGPGRYDPQDNYLSTKSKTPTIKIGKSLRFEYSQSHSRKLVKSPCDSSVSSMSKTLLLSESCNSPSYSFKRTGHNLKLVENPNFPGVGKYCLLRENKHKAFSFSRSKRYFDWRKDMRNLPKLVEFDRKYS